MQCVVFDMDGVLFDSEALVLQCWEQTAKLHGIPEIQEICHRCLGSNADMARQMFLEKYGADFPYDTYKAEMSAKYWENVEAGRLELKSGVREMLTALRAHGWKTGIASSTRAMIVRKEMQHFGLEQMFDHRRRHGAARQAESGDLPDYLSGTGRTAGRGLCGGGFLQRDSLRRRRRHAGDHDSRPAAAHTGNGTACGKNFPVYGRFSTIFVWISQTGTALPFLHNVHILYNSIKEQNGHADL